MDQSIRLGRIAGIPVGVNWSVLGIFLLVVWELSELVLPAYYPHSSTTAYWIVGFITTVLFFGSLLAHEASHSVVAKRNGVGVRRITLWLFGGVSELESEALTAGADFRIAVVGPVASFVLAGFFGAVRLLLLKVGLGGVLIPAMGWLAWMNLLLGGFNLLPGAPLDGGRVLRAFLWYRSNDRLHAASVAAYSGQVLGYMLIGFGIVEFLAGSLGGIWLVFMGWFLLSAARAEESSTVMRSSLAGVHVRDIMTLHPVTFSSTMTVGELLNMEELQGYRFNSFPLVGSDGELEGLATLGRIRRLAPELQSKTRLKDIACPLDEVPVGAADEPIADLLQRMEASPDGRAFVMDANGHLIGIISPTDIARYVQLLMLRSQGLTARRR
ncbi:MAG: site-2 protease family protein [Actinomycetota bacterium]|jgi:Zn-dependent protease|nr:site-2 protease family protein [Actinomycetota bacterium]